MYDSGILRNEINDIHIAVQFPTTFKFPNQILYANYQDNFVRNSQLSVLNVPIAPSNVFKKPASEPLYICSRPILEFTGSQTVSVQLFSKAGFFYQTDK